MTTTPDALVGSQVHFLKPLTIPVSTSMWATSVSMTYGDVLDVTDEVVEAGYPRDRQGHWLELADDPEAQVERYGQVMFGIGPFPDSLPKKDPSLVALEDLFTTKYINSSTVINTRPQRHGSFTVASSIERKSVQR